MVMSSFGGCEGCGGYEGCEGRRSKIEGCGGCGGYRESVGRIYVVGMSGVEKSLKSEIEIYAVEGDCGNCLVR